MTASDYRKDFPLLQNEDTIYIDNAATAQRPQAVLDAVKVFYETENANPLRGFYPLSLKLPRVVRTPERQYEISFMQLPRKRLFLQEIQQKG